MGAWRVAGLHRARISKQTIREKLSPRLGRLGPFEGTVHCTASAQGAMMLLPRRQFPHR